MKLSNALLTLNEALLHSAVFIQVCPISLMRKRPGVANIHHITRLCAGLQKNQPQLPTRPRVLPFANRIPDFQRLACCGTSQPGKQFG